MPRYVELKMLTANQGVVFDLVDELRRFWEKLLNEYPAQRGHGPIDYIDGAMAAHNFHKLAVRHILEETAVSPEEAIAWLTLMRDTWVRAMNEDIANERRRAAHREEGA